MVIAIIGVLIALLLPAVQADPGGGANDTVPEQSQATCLRMLRARESHRPLFHQWLVVFVGRRRRHGE